MSIRFCLLLSLSVLSNILHAQNFGCYDASIPNGSAYDYTYSRSLNSSRIEWKDFILNTTMDSGIVEEYYAYKIKDSIPSLKMKGVVINGKQEGPWVLYSMDHKEKAVGNFVNAKKEGLWKIYTKQEQSDTFLNQLIYFKNDIVNQIKIRLNVNGDTIETEGFKQGISHGVHARFANHKQDTFLFIVYTNGKKDGRSFERYRSDSIWKYRYDVNYSNNKLNGDVKLYYPNGVLCSHLIYKHNIPYTLIRVQDINGNILDGGTLIEGNGVLHFYTDSGQLKSTFNYKDGCINGNILHYYSGRKIMEQGDYFSYYDTTMPAEPINLTSPQDYNIKAAHQLILKSHTNYATYDESGKITASINATNNLLSDTIQILEYNQNGSLSSRSYSFLKNDISVYERFDEDGILTSKVNYKLLFDSVNWWHSVKDGKAVFFHKNSILKAEVSYENNKEIGESHYYDDSGQLIRTKILYPNGSSINIFKGDTVNRTDSVGQKQGKWLYFSVYSCSEIPEEVQYYKNDTRIGEWYSYNINGSIWQKRTWINSSYNETERYFASGKLQSRGIMVDGLFYGKWKWYNEQTGRIEKEGFMIGMENKENGLSITEKESPRRLSTI